MLKPPLVYHGTDRRQEGKLCNDIASIDDFAVKDAGVVVKLNLSDVPFMLHH